MEFKKNKYNFWVQENPETFIYTQEYKQKQSTNIEMSYLRLGWLSNYISDLKNMNMVDIGCGNRCFINCVKDKFKNAYGYDVSGESITKGDLYSLEWDLIVLSDVLEHFKDINDLFKINWKYAFISFPETPEVTSWEELKNWRHFKPNEHIWCLNKKGMINWLEDNNCTVLGVSNVEDLIRKPWDINKPNITSMIIKKTTYK